MKQANGQVIIPLPTEFLELCRTDGVTPETVLRRFIADVCGLTREQLVGPAAYCSDSTDDRDRAWSYYDRLHGYRAKWIRKNVPHLAAQMSIYAERSKDFPQQ